MVRPPKHLPGGDLEQAVLAALWEARSASARDIHNRVGLEAGLVYTTIAKVLDRLTAKKLVARELVGKAFIYKPLADQQVIQRARLRKLLIPFFGSEPEQVIAPLVDAVESIDADLLDELLRVVRDRRRKRDGS